MKTLSISCGAVIWLFLLIACTAKQATEVTAPSVAAVPTKATPASVSPAKTGVESRWDSILAAARKEGAVAISGNLTSTSRAEMSKAFQEKYGIDLEITAGRPELLLTKTIAERRAGLYTVDIYQSGGTSAAEFKRAGLLDPIEPALVLPEVTDLNAWMGGKINFVDKERKIIIFFTHAASGIIINTNLVQPEEIKSFKDLLNPRWKSKIVMDNPTVSGAGNSFFSFCIAENMGVDFARELVKQDLRITADARLLVEWVAKGSYPIGLAPTSQVYQEFLAAGAPLKTIIPVEGTHSTGGAGGVALINRAPHPNGAIVFINWLLSREGQIVMAKTAGDQSRRLDVTTEYIDDDRKVKPGIKYLETDNEEMIEKRLDRMKEAREIFGPLLK